MGGEWIEPLNQLLRLLDRLVNYVAENGLGGALRKALRDEGLLP